MVLRKNVFMVSKIKIYTCTITSLSSRKIGRRKNSKGFIYHKGDFDHGLEIEIDLSHTYLYRLLSFYEKLFIDQDS